MWLNERKKRVKRKEMMRHHQNQCINGRLTDILKKEELTVSRTEQVARKGVKEHLSESDLVKGSTYSRLGSLSKRSSSSDSAIEYRPKATKGWERQKMLEDSKSISRSQRLKEWASLFRRADPRHRIYTFFQDVAQEEDINYGFHPRMNASLSSQDEHVSVFTVWRPTSMDAIRKMMKKEAVGKTLAIKGKSAKAGKLSAYVPFLQIHKESHKTMIRTIPKDATMKIFYQSEELRNDAIEELSKVANDMIEGFLESRKTLADESADEASREAAMECFMWEMVNPEIVVNDVYASKNVWGIEIPERLAWEAYVIRNDITREGCSDYDTKRPSTPAFQDMNLKALRDPVRDSARPVVWQYSKEDAMCPLNLLMAYDEKGRVLPVVSDFDCFLMGTFGASYEDSLPPNQVEMLQGEVSCIETILDSPPTSDSWTTRWLELLKTEPMKTDIPKYGLGDPQSYHIMQEAIKSLGEEGSVRHGAECFNYYFPQELDSQFLVISDDLPGRVPWQYVDVNGLQNFLLKKVETGYTFPLNIKWVLCDPGWKEVYDKLMASNQPTVQNSMEVWFPQCLRQRIEEIHQRHPDGFVRKHGGVAEEQELEGTEAMDLAVMELKYYRTWQRAKLKLRMIFFLMKFAKQRKADKARSALSEQTNRKATEGVREDISELRKSITVTRLMTPTLEEESCDGAADGKID